MVESRVSFDCRAAEKYLTFHGECWGVGVLSFTILYDACVICCIFATQVSEVEARDLFPGGNDDSFAFLKWHVILQPVELKRRSSWFDWTGDNSPSSDPHTVRKVELEDPWFHWYRVLNFKNSTSNGTAILTTSYKTDKSDEEKRWKWIKHHDPPGYRIGLRSELVLSYGTTDYRKSASFWPEDSEKVDAGKTSYSSM